VALSFRIILCLALLLTTGPICACDIEHQTVCEPAGASSNAPSDMCDDEGVKLAADHEHGHGSACHVVASTNTSLKQFTLNVIVAHEAVVVRILCPNSVSVAKHSSFSVYASDVSARCAPLLI